MLLIGKQHFPSQAVGAAAGVGKVAWLHPAIRIYLELHSIA